MGKQYKNVILAMTVITNNVTTKGAFNIAGDDESSTTVTIGGDLTLNDALIVDGGSLTVTGAFDSATSAANAISIGANKKSVVELSGNVTTSDNSSNNSAVTLSELGTLKVGYDKVADGLYEKVNNWSNAFDASSKGTLILTDAGSTLSAGTIALDDYDTLMTNVLGSNGGSVNLKLEGVTIDTSNSYLDGITDKDRTLSDNVIKVADNTAVIVGNNTTVKALDATEVTQETVITVGNSGNGTLILAGDAADNYQLVQNESGDNLKFNVTGDGTLQLGIADETSLKGTLNKTVTVADNSALKAFNGEFSIKEIALDTANGASSGSSVTLADAKLTISEGDVQVASVTKDSGDTAELVAAAGNISVTGNVDGAALTAANNGATITVGGNVSNGAALTADGDISITVTVANSSLTSSNGGITLGGAVSGNSSLRAENGAITTSNNVAANDIVAATFTSTGTVELTGGEFNLTGTGNDASSITGAFTADNMSGTVADITFDNTAKISNGSVLNFGKVEMTGGDLTIGDSASDSNASTVTIENLKLGSNTLVAASKADVDTPTVVAVENFVDDNGDASKTVNGLVNAKTNSIVVLGSRDTSAALAAVITDLTAEDGSTKAFGGSGDFKGAVYIDAPLTLDANGGIAAGSSASAAAGQIDINSDGLMVVNGNNIAEGTAAISDVDGSTVNINGAVNIVKDSKGDVTLFDGSNLDGVNLDLSNGQFFTNNRYLAVENITQSDTAVTVSVAANSSNNPAYSGFSDNLGSLVAAAANAGTNEFINNVANNGLLTDAQAAAVIEGAAKAPMIIGAPKIALDVATIGSDYAMARTSFAPRVAGAYAMDNDGQAQNIASGDNMANGMNVWIMPMYEHASVDGLDSGLYTLDYDTDFYGVAVGADYTWDNSFRLGATLNFGTGDAETKSGSSFSKTENDYDSLGAGLYAGYMFGNFGLSGDFMYTHVKNDIDQKVAGYGTLSAEGDTDVISLGLRAEYKYETAVMDIIPHAGIRYNHVDMDDMTFSGQLTTIADSANIWQLPVGVTFSREIAAESGWNVKPSLDLSLIPAFGDTDMEQSVRFAGVNGLATMNTEIMDELSGRAQVGIEASKGNFYMGLDYAYQGSSNIDAHQVQANFGFKF